MTDAFYHDSTPSSPSAALVPVDPNWHPILQVSNQVVLYNPTNHALSVHHSGEATHSASRPTVCPYCARPLPNDDEDDSPIDADFDDVASTSRAPNYFQLLEVANETASRPSSPPLGVEDEDEESSANESANNTFKPSAMAEGYFKAFFREEARIGMGANGSVYLCQHVLNGNPLGHFAVKKIAVGQSSSYLLQILREVRLLETLRHPNIITYHHAWLEPAQFSSFGPSVPTLHVLMQWAEGGSLDDFIDARLGRPTNLPHVHSSGPTTPRASSTSLDAPSPDGISTPPSGDTMSRAARIRAFRAMQHASPEEKERIRERYGMGPSGGSGSMRKTNWKAVHLLSAEEVKGLFADVAQGLAFLHDKSILHLDLKPGNVLLTWDEGSLIPRAMLSDFGTSRDAITTSLQRSGNTGTLEYISPESLRSPETGELHQVDSKADLWSLGMILHKLLFFRLPYHWASGGDRDTTTVRDGENPMDNLESEVLGYKGFKSNRDLETTFLSRRLPRAYLILLENLLHIVPASRPSCERVVAAIREGKLDPLRSPPRSSSSTPNASTSLLPVLHRRTSPPLPALSPPPLSRPSAQGQRHERDSDARARLSELSPSAEFDDNPLTPTVREDTDSRTSEDEKGVLLDPGAPRALGSAAEEAGWKGASANVSVGVYRGVLGAGDAVNTRRMLWTRALKSCLLVAKVLSLSYYCPAPRFTGFADESLRTLCLLIGVVDTLMDSWTVSGALLLVHVLLLRALCVYS